MPVAATTHQGDGVCAILDFADPESEASYLADLIHEEIRNGASPRDFCILARQTTGNMIALLQSELRSRGISIRDESSLQDLRVEPISYIAMLVLRLAISKRDPEAWSDLMSELSILTGLDEESENAELEQITLVHKKWAQEFLSNGADIRSYPRGILEIIGPEKYRASYRQYMNGNYLEKVTEDLGNALGTSLDNAGSIEGLVTDFIGEDIVPAMSIHKSKGLEFKTVIFMGLEDEQWWNFREQPEEEKRAFFVAFSRAIQSVLFTCSRQRPKWGRLVQTNRNQVGALFDILQQAGVELIEVGNYSGN